jgi:localization factor PodJL
VSAISSDGSPSPDKTGSLDELVPASGDLRIRSTDGGEEAASVLAAFAKILPSCLAGTATHHESRADLVRKLDELGMKLQECGPGGGDSLKTALIELDAALRAWDHKPRLTVPPADIAAAKSIRETAPLLLPPFGDKKRLGEAGPLIAEPNLGSVESEAVPRAGADYADRCENPDDSFATGREAENAHGSSSVGAHGLAVAANTLPAAMADHYRYEAFAKQIETAHRQLALQLETGLAAAAAEMDTLKTIVGDVLKQIELMRDTGQARQAGAMLEEEIARLTSRFERMGESLAPLPSLESSVGDISVRLEELHRIVVSLSNASSPNTSTETFSPEGAQAILRGIASLQTIHEETAKRTDAALIVIKDSLEHIAGLCARLESYGKEGRDTWSGAFDPSDPFAPILSHLKQHGEDASLAMKGQTGSKITAFPRADRSGGGEQQQRVSWPDETTPGSTADAAGFLIEPGRGFPHRGASAESREQSPQPIVSQVCDERTGRTDFIAAARRAARMAQMELRGSAPQSPAEDSAGENQHRSLRGQCRGLFAKYRRSIVVSAAVLFAAIGAYALGRTLIRLHPGNSVSVLKQWHESIKQATPAATGEAPADKAMKLSASMPPADRLPSSHAVKGEAKGVEVPAASFESAKAAVIDPLAPAQPLVHSGAEDQAAGRVISRSDGILAETMRSADMPAIAPVRPPVNALPSSAPLPGAQASPSGRVAPTQPVSLPADPEPEKSLIARAEAGDVAAQFDLAVRYAEGRSGAHDYELAAKWYSKAAQQGHAIAQYRLALLYEKGLGVAKDMERAKELYQRAAERGNVRAMHNLGVLAAEGADGKPNYTSAALWFAQAAEYGVRDSQYNLAVLLARGLGVPKDLVKSYTWFAILAAAGDAGAARKRDEVGARLTTTELAAANTAAAAFAQRPADRAANEALLPQSAQQTAPAQEGLVKPKVSGL